MSNAASDARSAGETRQAASSIQESGNNEEGGFISFLKGLLDIINPLQHIPVISTLYRAVTGDEIAPMAKMAGAALYGGPVGAVVACADIAAQKTTGKDIGQNVMAMLDGKDKEAPETQLAAADLNNIAPAAGADKNNIIWHAPDTPHSPPDTPTERTVGNKPVTHIPQIARSPVLQEKAPSAAAFTAVARAKDLPTHDAPATAARTAAAPEPNAPQIVMPDVMPERMMEGLEKYAALKKSQMHGRTAGREYSAQF